MKKTILLLIALLGSIIFGYSQSLENMGDEAFIQGKYKEAEEYFKEANKLEPSDVLKEKIKKSKTLKNEFEIIDRAIAQQDYDKAKIHIEIVQREDPGNLWALDRSKAIGTGQTRKTFKRTFKGIDAENFDLQRRTGISASLGISYNLWKEMVYPMTKVSMFFFSQFPITFDFIYQLDLRASNNHLHAFGLGSEYFLSKKWMIDYGLGYMWNKESNTRGPYLRGGITYRFWRDSMGISYLYDRGLSFGPFHNKAKGHFFVVTWFLGA